MSRKIVFLDRDGVLNIPRSENGKGYAPRTLEQFRFYPDAKNSVKALKEAAFRVVVVTNQPDVEAGYLSSSTLDSMHQILKQETDVDAIRVCPHLSSSLCNCRKPRTGMLDAEIAEGGIVLEASWMVGDRDSDIRAGENAGLHTIFIERGWKEETGVSATRSVSSLSEAVTVIVASYNDIQGLESNG